MCHAGNARQTVCKRRKMERKKTIAVIRLHSDELGEFWQGLGDSIWILDICLKHSNEMNRNDKRCSCLFLSGHSRKLAKIPIPNHLYQAFDQAGKSFSDYKPGTNWCTKCKVEEDKKFKEHGKYIPRNFC